MRLHRDANHLPPKRGTRKSSIPASNPPTGIEDLESMSNEELVEELIKARIAEARLKRLRSEGGWFGTPAGIPNNPGAFRGVSCQNALPNHENPEKQFL